LAELLSPARRLEIGRRWDHLVTATAMQQEAVADIIGTFAIPATISA
jgi:hypothetical protein